MFRAALVLLLTGAACAQIVPPGSTSVHITDWHVTPAVLTASADATPTSPAIHCDLFAQHPGAGELQAACYLGTALVFNGVMTVSADMSFTCGPTTSDFGIAWSLVPDVLPAIKFQLFSEFHGFGPPLFFAAPITSSLGVAALGGIF